MPKVEALVLDSKLIHKDDKTFKVAMIRFNQQMPPKGEKVFVKWGAIRSLEQNAFLWTFYTWLINEGGLKDWGFFCPEAFHESIKAHFLSKKIMDKGQWKVVEEGTSTLLTKAEFIELIDKINNFVIDFFEIDTFPFFDQYAKEYSIH